MAAVPALAQPQIAPNGVLDGAGFVVGQPVAIGSAVSIFGSGLAASLLAGDTVPLSTSLNGVQVTFNGIAAPLYFVSDRQINAQVPWNVLQGPATAAAVGSVDVVVTSQGVSSPPLSVPIAHIAPNVFAFSSFAIAINADGTLAAPAGAIPGLTTHPTHPGDVLLIYANGLGPVDHPVESGAPGGSILRTNLTTPVVLIGGQPAQVLFSGLTPQFPGINQVNLVVPNVPAGDAVPIQLQSDGITSSDQVVIAVE